MAERTTCLVVGGGPAGMICGLLLARAGVRVTVLEKHADFFRDFRGDTVHPSTLQLLDELGLATAFDRIPYSRIERIRIPVEGGGDVVVGDFTRLHTPHPYVAMTPQWDFLTVLAEAGRDEPTFELRMSTEATELIREDGRVTGVRGTTGGGTPFEIRADLVIGCDGRWSRTRQDAVLPVIDHPVNADVWWFRVQTPQAVGENLLPRGGAGGLFILIPRRGYLQIAHLIPKGSDAARRAEGDESLRSRLASAVPELARAVSTVDLSAVKLLEVQVNRLRRWWAPGLLCIGDAAHAMSPVGGVGVNLAVQDGVAAAARLARPLLNGKVSDQDLIAVQRRRAPAAVVTQALQLGVHRALGPLLQSGRPIAIPRSAARVFRTLPALSAIPARVVGIGVRPEHAPEFARRPAGGVEDQ